MPLAVDDVRSSDLKKSRVLRGLYKRLSQSVYILSSLPACRPRRINSTTLRAVLARPTCALGNIYAVLWSAVVRTDRRTRTAWGRGNRQESVRQNWNYRVFFVHNLAIVVKLLLLLLLIKKVFNITLDNFKIHFIIVEKHETVYSTDYKPVEMCSNSIQSLQHYDL